MLVGIQRRAHNHLPAVFSHTYAQCYKTKVLCSSGKVSIFTEDQTEPVTVDCTATIVSSTFELMNEEGAAMGQLDFGALHYGDDKHVTFSVLNNGPKPARFFAACGTPQQLAEDSDGTPRDDPMTAFLQVEQFYSLH